MRETSPKDPSYNCIAWALGFTHVSLWPDRLWVDMLWPREKPEIVTLQEFTEVFALFGYCSSSEIFRPGFEKIALYRSPSGDIEHAARQFPDNGKWTSKLGGGIDILQDFPGDFPMYEPYLSGCRSYGGAAYFYERSAANVYPTYEEVAEAHGQWPLAPRLWLRE